MKRELKKRRTTRVERNARWLLQSRRPVWIRVQALLLLLPAIVTIGSFFEVIFSLALSLLFPELVLPETGYPTCIFLVVFCLCFSCVVRNRGKIFFIRTNLVRENENEFSFVWGHSKYVLFFLCVFFRICSYTF